MALKNLTPRQRLYAKKLLVCIANKQKTITYGELALGVTAAIQTVGKDIGELSKHCVDMGLPPISGMVVNKSTQYPDIEGFGGLCKELDLYQDCKDYDELVTRCLMDIHECASWHKLASYIGEKIEGISYIPDPVATFEQSELIEEGARIQITATVYERDPANRAKCLRKWGATCQICGFDAAKVYGKEFEGLIQVHHIEPLGIVGEAHIIDPEKDLIPVCPNCHMILHAKKGGVHTPEEVKAMLKIES